MDKPGPALPTSTGTQPHDEQPAKTPPFVAPQVALDLLIDSVLDYAIFMLDPNGTVISWNRGAERLKGYSPSQVIGKNFSIFYPAEDIALQKPRDELLLAVNTGRYEEEGWRVRKDGSRFWANVVITPVYNAQHQLQGYAKVTRNFDDRRQLLEEVRQSEERFRLLVSCVKDYAIFMLLPDGTIASWNEGAERAKGYSAGEAIGKHFSMFYTPEDRASGKPAYLLRQAFEQGRVEDEGWRVRKDGTRFWADVILTAVKDEKGRLRGFAKVTRDVTERKLAAQTITEKQQQILELQKMEAIGRLAGGIAHDFNNLIAGILGCADTLEPTMIPNSEAAEEVRQIQKACERAGNLTRQLLAFSRRQIASPTVIQLNDEIAELQKMLVRLIGSDVRMEMRLAPALPPIKMDPGQLQQIIVNLVLNARDAMPSGGSLTLQTQLVKLDELSATQEFSIPSGEYIMLSITDAGTGMSADVRQHIFEPFYTTKPLGKGTGLGLATVYGIVQQNSGMIMVYSEPNVGTSFKIFMPIHSDGAHPQQGGDDPSVSAAAWQGSETILVAEDDPLVLRNTVRSLQGRGDTVLSAADGQAAMEMLGKVQGKIDLLITDVMMPNMNGKELADAVHQSLPALPVIFMSGFSADLVTERGILKKDVSFMEKPFNGLALAQKVRHVLDTLPPEPPRSNA